MKLKPFYNIIAINIFLKMNLSAKIEKKQQKTRKTAKTGKKPAKNRQKNSKKPSKPVLDPGSQIRMLIICKNS